MLDIAKITDPTGNAYMPENHKTDLSMNRAIEPSIYQLISDETGNDSRLPVLERLDYIQDTFPYRLLAATTGADIYGCREVHIFIDNGVAIHNSITNVSFCVNEAAQKKTPKRISIHLSQALNSSRKKHGIMDLANRLREFSGLDIESLAQIFKVSRVTYHRWLRSLPVSKRHHDHMLEILPLIEEAVQRLGSPEVVSTWLLTPVSSGGKKPIEYLVERHYDLFRGFLLHQRTGKEQFRPLKPSNRVFKPRKREEVEDVREQLRPHTWYDEIDDLNSNND
jgi:hypothetical protein